MDGRFVTRAARALALLWATWLLAGCGGGGDDSEPAASSPSTASSNGYYLWNVASSNWGQWHWLAVVDPAQPSAPRHSLLMTTADGTPAWPRGVSGTRLDPANRRITMLGTSRLFYLQQGKVHTLDLAMSHQAAPVRLSSITNGCWLWNTYSMDAAGEDVWVEVETAGADGRCDRYFDNDFVAVRTTMTATSPALPLPAGTPRSMFVLPDENGRALGLLVQMPDHLRVYDTDLASNTEVANSDSTIATWELGLFAGARKLYLGTYGDNSSTRSVRELSYSGQSASLSAEVMPLESPQAAPQRGDWDTFYFSDRQSLYKLTADGPSLLADYTAGNVYQITPTTNHVVVRLYESTSSSWSTWSVAKSGGTPVDLYTPERAANGTENFVHWGTVAGDRYFFFSEDVYGLGSIYSVDADGRNAQTWASGVGFAGALYRRTPEPGQWWEQVTDFVYCVPLTGRTDCDGGTMKQLNVATQGTTRLGTLPQPGNASRSVQYTFAWGFADSPISIGTQLYDNAAGASAYDLFIATAGKADSLQAATYNYAAP